MVTETNDLGSESTVEVTEAPLNLDDGAGTPAPEVTTDLVDTADPPIEVVPEPEPQANTEEPVRTTDTTPTTGAANPELSKYQSATDKRIAEMETQLGNERAARSRAEQIQNSSNLEAEVNAYGQQLAQRYLDQGLDDATARQMAQQQTSLAKEAYLAKQQANQVVEQSKQMQNELNTRTQLAKAYELSTQYGVPYAELQDSPDPQSMEKMAKALARINKLEQRVQQVTPGQRLNGANPASDVAPTNSEDVLDRYNAGDPAITTEMASAASKKLGYSIFN
tara:strand:+ start:292 stop:1131 length:840 start_codon:yes stop_codon:yes gene_type:complete